ncbi:carbohydrate-selective porin, OprB family [delta proteobacterium NaphS2]|nr:carbohydrate-selective porin, OprB family [delta proteobacterium NaphS2]
MDSIKKRCPGLLFAILGIVLIWVSQGFSYDINDKFSIGGIIAGVYQYQSLSDAPDYDSEGRGALVFQPEISFKPTDSDEVFAKFGFGAGNGLMEDGQSPFFQAPWAADVQDDYKDINGRNRDYLLTVWYKHTFTFSENHTLGLTGGIIDATDYLDENAFSNDEFTQFMNEALVNGPNAFLPSYDIGGAIEWELGAFSVKGAAMAMGSTEEEGELNEPYNYYGIQFGYRLVSALGEGNYRLIVDTTSDDFSNVAGTAKEQKTCTLISFDQQLGEILGAWIRFAWQLEDAVSMDCKDLYSGGLNIGGNLWGRENDNVGIGYAHLRGGNLDLDHTDVFEIYGRFALNDIFDITGDVQYMKDSMKVGESPSGWIFGLRATAEF